MRWQQLSTGPGEGQVADQGEAQEIIRALIDRVVLKPSANGGMEALLHGELAAILALTDSGSRKANGPADGRAVHAVVSMVAGARNSHYLLFALIGLRAIR